MKPGSLNQREKEENPDKILMIDARNTYRSIYYKRSTLKTNLEGLTA